MFFPREHIKVDISLVIDRILEQIENEAHTAMPITTAFTKNFDADSTLLPV